MSPKNMNKDLKKEQTVKKTLAKNNLKTSDQWWGAEDTEKVVHRVGTMKTAFNSLPNGSGFMLLFKDKLSVKLQDCRLMSAVDENNKLCVSLTDEQFEFFELLSRQLESTLIARLKLMNPNHADAGFLPSVKVSEQTEQKYLKTKVQLLGASRTMGCGLDGAVSDNVPATLSHVGASADIRIRVDGVYLTKERCGIMSKVDLFKLKSIPSEEEVEKERETKKRRLHESRMEEMSDF